MKMRREGVLHSKRGKLDKVNIVQGLYTTALPLHTVASHGPFEFCAVPELLSEIRSVSGYVGGSFLRGPCQTDPLEN